MFSQNINDFQKLIYLIHHQLANEATITESEYLYDRAANADREVDIVIQKLIGVYQVIIGIECQGRGRIASVEWVEQMVAKHETLSTLSLHSDSYVILPLSQGMTFSSTIIFKKLMPLFTFLLTKILFVVYTIVERFISTAFYPSCSAVAYKICKPFIK